MDVRPHVRRGDVGPTAQQRPSSLRELGKVLLAMGWRFLGVTADPGLGPAEGLAEIAVLERHRSRQSAQLGLIDGGGNPQPAVGARPETAVEGDPSNRLAAKGEGGDKGEVSGRPIQPTLRRAALAAMTALGLVCQGKVHPPVECSNGADNSNAMR